jgi:hypothetical protein
MHAIQHSIYGQLLESESGAYIKFEEIAYTRGK